MNIFVWVIQGMLALLLLPGGYTKAFKFDSLATVPAMGALPQSGWLAVGLFEIACGFLLIIPLAVGIRPQWSAHTAAIVAVESLVLSGLYARHSTALEATNPLMWTLIMLALALIAAYGRYVLVPAVA